MEKIHIKSLVGAKVSQWESLWNLKWILGVILILLITDCGAFGQVEEETGDWQELWRLPILSCVIISLVPFLILFTIPLQNQDNQNRLKIFASFASGGLLGDTFFHLIPHANILLAKSHHKIDPVGLWILVGFLGYLILEKITRILQARKCHPKTQAKIDPSIEKLAKPSSAENLEKLDKLEENDKSKSCEKMNKIEEPEKEGDLKSQKSKSSELIPPPEIVSAPEIEQKMAGYLILIGDMAHNFIDGLAIGVSYFVSPAQGMTTTVAVLCHEIPHEIGDFALLIRSGSSKKKAIYFQLLTAVGAFAGTAVALTLRGKSADPCMLSVIAGSFIYIAAVSVIPEILKGSQFWQSVKEILALFLGLGLMYALAEYEEPLKIELMNFFEDQQVKDNSGNIFERLVKIQDYMWKLEM